MANQEHIEAGNHNDFWSQAPVVLFAIAAVIAIVVVNRGMRAAVPPPAVAPATAVVEVQLTPVDCPDCGEVIAIRAADADEVGAPDPALHGVILEVRMSDGTVRIVRQFSAGFDVGDHVQVNGNALVARD